MACQNLENAARPLPVEFSTLAVWLPSINDNALALLRRLKAARAEILGSHAAGRLECRFAVFAGDAGHLLKIEVARAGLEIPFGSVTICCGTGRVFRTYAVDTDKYGKRDERLYFHGLEDATRYLIFTARMALEREARAMTRDARFHRLPAMAVAGLGA